MPHCKQQATHIEDLESGWLDWPPQAVASCKALHTCSAYASASKDAQRHRLWARTAAELQQVKMAPSHLWFKKLCCAGRAAVMDRVEPVETAYEKAPTDAGWITADNSRTTSNHQCACRRWQTPSAPAAAAASMVMAAQVQQQQEEEALLHSCLGLLGVAHADGAKGVDVGKGAFRKPNAKALELILYHTYCVVHGKAAAKRVRGPQLLLPLAARQWHGGRSHHTQQLQLR